MVLHNNKWDRRAKWKYMKKHGLSKPSVESEEPSVPDVVEEIDVDELLKAKFPELPEDTSEEGKEKLKQEILDEIEAETLKTNAWRYKELPISVANEEHDDMDYNHMVRITDDYNSIHEQKLSQRKVDQFSTDELLQMTLDGSKSTADPGKQHIKVLNQDEMDQHRFLQAKIEKSNLYSSMKEKFGEKELKSSKIISIYNPSSELDQRDLLNSKLSRISKETETISLDDDLAELLGERLTIGDEKNEIRQLDVEDLMIKKEKVNTTKKPTFTTAQNKLVLKDEDFLDDLLG